MKSIVSRLVFILLFGFGVMPYAIFAQNQTTNSRSWTLDPSRSEISYTGVHLLHQWTGVNKKLVGLMTTSKDQIDMIAVSAKVADFDSGNENRDAHALELLDVFDFPNVRFLAKKFTQSGQQVVMQGLLQFRGVSRDISVTMTVEPALDQYKVFGAFTVQPTLFDMPLPSFMLKDIDDALEVEVSLMFIPSEQ
ncbi:MAG: YceI family protein [Bacteroidetes bacterium]|nr:YceI family protein [Bacteroidota bacterium]MDA1210086.1 YceI family protein [Bacteroidota bacterium]